MSTENALNEARQQRQAALEALTTARKTRYRAEDAKTKAFQELATFMLKHRGDLPTYVQDYLKHWEVEKRQLDKVAEAARMASGEAAAFYLNSTNDIAKAINAYNGERTEAHIKHYTELEANRVAPDSKLAQLLGRLNRGPIRGKLPAITDRSKA